MRSFKELAVESIAGIHGLPIELVERQAELLEEVIGYIDDVLEVIATLWIALRT